VAVVGASVPFYFKLGREFMPPLNEGTILYMPTTLPGISVGAAQDLLQTQDRVLKSVPEVSACSVRRDAPIHRRIRLHSP